MSIRRGTPEHYYGNTSSVGSVQYVPSGSTQLLSEDIPVLTLKVSIVALAIGCLALGLILAYTFGKNR